MDELKQLIQKQNEAFAAFKAANDAEINALKKGANDPVLKAQVDKANADVSAIQKQIDELQKKMQRPGASPDQGDELKSAHRKAFGRYMRKGDLGDLADLQVKTLQIGVDADGGYAVPEQLDTAIGKMEIFDSPMEALVSAIVAGAETYEKLFDLRGTASGWVGETAARPVTATPQLGSFKPTYGELYASPQATQKMLDDAFFDVEAWLASSVAEKFAQDLDLAIISGDGVNKPKGILAYTLAQTGDAARAFGTIEKKHTGTSAGGITADFLMDLQRLLKAGYRANSLWLMAGATLDTVRKLKDTTNQYIWQPGLADGSPAKLLGRPVVEDENVPAIGAASKSIIYGDFKRAYKLVNLRGVRVLRDPFTSKPNVIFYSTKRVGGGVEDTAAVKVVSCEV
jgi:HK97 family phage major capsid protein